MVKRKKIKKSVNNKKGTDILGVVKKDNTLLAIGGLVIIGVLLFGYAGVPTGQVTGDYEKPFSNSVVLYKVIEGIPLRDQGINYKGFDIKLIETSVDNGYVIISVDGRNSGRLYFGGCGDEQGTWAISRLGGGLFVRVCAVGTNNAELDFRL